MTAYSVILALPRLENARMSPGEAELRLLIALAGVHPNGHGERSIGTRLLAARAHMSHKTVCRARDRLVKAGRLAVEAEARHRTTWRFTVDIQGGDSSDDSVPTQGGDSSASVVINVGTDEQGAAAQSVDITPPICGQPGRAHDVVPSEHDESGSVAGELSRARAGARDDDAQPDWRRGPGDERALTGRVIPPGGRRDRGTPMPPNITGAGRYHPPQAVTDEGAAKVRAAMAEGFAKRAARGGPEARRAVKDMTEDERRALALRQAATGRQARLAGEPPGGITPKEEPDEQPPF